MSNLSPRALALYQAHGPGPVDWERMVEITQPQWLPIETAPRDDVIVLTDGGMLYQGFYQDGRGWMSGLKSGAILITLELAPSHWQPLPPPPADPEKTGETDA